MDSLGSVSLAMHIHGKLRSLPPNWCLVSYWYKCAACVWYSAHAPVASVSCAVRAPLFSAVGLQPSPPAASGVLQPSPDARAPCQAAVRLAPPPSQKPACLRLHVDYLIMTAPQLCHHMIVFSTGPCSSTAQVRPQVSCVSFLTTAICCCQALRTVRADGEGSL